jgi:hypothetical protein
MSGTLNPSSKCFISSLRPAQTVWIQGTCVAAKSLDSGMANIAIDDGTGIVVCRPVGNQRGLESLRDHGNLVGKYVQVVGTSQSRTSSQADVNPHSNDNEPDIEVVVVKFFILDDPNLESLWNTEVLMAVH